MSGKSRTTPSDDLESSDKTGKAYVDERRDRQGLVRDDRNQDQPADKDRAQRGGASNSKG